MDSNLDLYITLARRLEPLFKRVMDTAMNEGSAGQPIAGPTKIPSLALHPRFAKIHLDMFTTSLKYRMAVVELTSKWTLLSMVYMPASDKDTIIDDVIINALGCFSDDPRLATAPYKDIPEYKELETTYEYATAHYPRWYIELVGVGLLTTLS